MDLLESLNIPVLPEQQTCINSRVSSALRSNPDIRLGFDACCICAAPLKERREEEGKSNSSDGDDGGDGGDGGAAVYGVPCKVCKRVWYCSKKCRREDSNMNSVMSNVNATANNNNSNNNHDDTMDEQARGHSSIICALLRLCQIDEDVEDYSSPTSPPTSSSSPSNDDERLQKLSTEEREGAKLRITSEYESYPATLANTIMDAPCFRSVLEIHSLPPRSTTRQKQKKGRTLLRHDPHHHHHNHHHHNQSHGYVLDEERHRSLTMHVIGASEEAELWGSSNNANDDNTTTTTTSPSEDVHTAYADALAELVMTYRGITTINLIFVGPNCPKRNRYVERFIDLDGNNGVGGVVMGTGMGMGRHDDDATDGKKRKHGRGGRKHDDGGEERGETCGDCKIVVETHRCNYDLEYLKHGPLHGKSKKKKSSSSSSSSSHGRPPPKADIVIFFNPGYTCPDYSWTDALEACCKSSAHRTTTTTTNNINTTSSTTNANRNKNDNNTNNTGIPFIVTTNTEMEAISDLQWLHRHGYIDSLPPAVADIVVDGIGDHDADEVEFSDSSNMFFGENPNAGIRVRQSGNMGNDLFVKNRWIFGGVFHCDDGTSAKSERSSSSSSSRKVDKEKTPSTEKKSSGGEGPSKKDVQDKKKKKKRKNLALM